MRAAFSRRFGSFTPACRPRCRNRRGTDDQGRLPVRLFWFANHVASAPQAGLFVLKFKEEFKFYCERGKSRVPNAMRL